MDESIAADVRGLGPMRLHARLTGTVVLCSLLLLDAVLLCSACSTAPMRLHVRLTGTVVLCSLLLLGAALLCSARFATLGGEVPQTVAMAMARPLKRVGCALTPRIDGTGRRWYTCDGSDRTWARPAMV
jgi:hypothetical protein